MIRKFVTEVFFEPQTDQTNTVELEKFKYLSLVEDS